MFGLPWSTLTRKMLVRHIFFILFTDYMAISQVKVPLQHINLLSVHLINPVNRWNWATTRCHHIYLQACLKVHNVCQLSSVFYAFIRKTGIKQCFISFLWLIKIRNTICFKSCFWGGHVRKIWFTGSVILAFSLTPPCRQWFRFIWIHLSNRFWLLKWSRANRSNILSSPAKQNPAQRSF